MERMGDSTKLDETKANKSLEDIVMNSTLSVDAAVFVPKTHSGLHPMQQQHQKQRQQQQHQKKSQQQYQKKQQQYQKPYHHQQFQHHPMQQYQQPHQMQQYQQPHQQQQQPHHHLQQSPSVHTSKSSIQDRIQRAREGSNQTLQQQYSYSSPQSYPQEQTPQPEGVSYQMSNNQDFCQFGEGMGDNKHKNQEMTEDPGHSRSDFTNVARQLLDVVHLLSLTPGRFSSVVPAVIKSIRPYLKFPNQFQEIIFIIIQWSIVEDNFRYSGARLCTSFDTSVSASEQVAFRNMLYTQCKDETEKQATNWQQNNEHSEVKQKRCHGLMLFLAELVTQMEDISSCDLGELLIQLITTVLKNPAPNSVKHICQALKLAGQTLERDKKGSREDMENMMRALTQLVTESKVDSHVGRMVNSVYELRNGNWGQSTPSTGSTAPTVENSQLTEPLDYPPDGPVFYGPDGQILSPEENQFLEDVAEGHSDEHMIGGQSDREVWLSEEEDEIDAAYEEFLKLIPNKVESNAQK